MIYNTNLDFRMMHIMMHLILHQCTLQLTV